MKTTKVLIPGLFTLALTSITMVSCQKETITPANMVATQPSFKHDSIIKVIPIGIDNPNSSHHVSDGAAKGQANETIKHRHDTIIRIPIAADKHVSDGAAKGQANETIKHKHDSIIQIKPLGIDDKKYVPDGAAKGQANETIKHKHDSIIQIKPLGIDDKKYVPDGAAKGQANETVKHK